ncbi:MAG: hypothetical protein HC834_00565, partial [Rhodospirillales bacterium]|nr:hypothetical protein [Rhodospirillales bacterium]
MTPYVQDKTKLRRFGVSDIGTDAQGRGESKAGDSRIIIRAGFEDVQFLTSGDKGLLGQDHRLAS